MQSGSLCEECARQGWVTWDEYQTDVAISEVWPEWMRNFYKRTVDSAIELVQVNQFCKYFFLIPAYCYIQTTNGVAEVNIWKLMHAVPFLLTFSMATPVAILVDIMKDSND